MTIAPTIETERLILRAPCPADAEGAIAFFLSDRSRFTVHAETRAEAWRTFALELGHWAMRGTGMWAVTERGCDDCLGLVGCWEPDGWPEREIGWLIWPEAEGRGIAQEAAIASRGCAYSKFGWDGAVSYIHRDNSRSIALAERVGCVLDQAARGPEATDLVYRHPSREALAA